MPILALLIATLVAGSAAGQQPVAAGLPSGQDLVRQAARELFHQPKLAAKVRQRVSLFGQQLSGPGVYEQLGDGSGRCKLELKLSVGGRPASLLHVCDGKRLWIRHEVLGERTSRMVNLEAIRRRTAERGGESAASWQNWMISGGLPGLLARLDEYFRFGSPQAVVLGGQLPAWRIVGVWKSERLVELLGQSEVDPRQLLVQLPPHLPHRVVLTLGRDDVLPLFPYQIVMERYDPTQQPAGAAALRPIFVLELLEVRRQPDMTEAQFEIAPDGDAIQDDTPRWLNLLRLDGQQDSPGDS